MNTIKTIVLWHATILMICAFIVGIAMIRSKQLTTNIKEIAKIKAQLIVDRSKTFIHKM